MINRDEAPVEIKRGLQDIGYTDALLIPEYPFADPRQGSQTIYRARLAAFIESPPSYRNAAVGVIDAQDAESLRNNRFLGASRLLEMRGDTVISWNVPTADGLEYDETIPAHLIREAIKRHEDLWGRVAMLRARGIGTVPSTRQLDFFDAGLVPEIEGLVRRKLDELLRQTLAACQQAYGTIHSNAQPDPKALFRLVFRLLAAKLLADRGHPGDWRNSDASAVLSAVEGYYYRTRRPQPALDDPQTQQVAWDRIRTSFPLQNITLDILADTYETTLVDENERREFGIHSTPAAVAAYLVRQLPFEDLAPDTRHVLDVFTGHGALLVAAMRKLRALLPDMPPDERHRYLVDMLHGIDVDTFALEIAWTSLIEADFPLPNGWSLDEKDLFAARSWATELGRADIVLGNPPFQAFTNDERALYGGTVTAQNKAEETIGRILAHPPRQLGLVLPRVFLNGQRFTTARRALATTYDDIGTLSLPENVFQYAEKETVLLTASGRRRRSMISVRSGTVSPTDVQQFVSTGRPSRYETVSVAREVLVDAPALGTPALHEVWEALEGRKKLDSLATVHRGLEFDANLLKDDGYASSVSDVPLEGFVPGLGEVEDTFEPFLVAAHKQVCIIPKYLRRGSNWNWARPKVLVNAVRRSRSAWVMTATSDIEGLVATQNFIGVWPKMRPGASLTMINVLAAIINGPVANAFVQTHSTAQHNQVRTVKDIPLPYMTRRLETRINELVREYVFARRAWLFGDDASKKGKCEAMLNQIDAEILSAYDLPPRLERAVLDYFAYVRRPGPLNFLGYISPKRTANLPWHMYVSGAVERANGHATLARLKTVRGAAVSTMLQEIGQSEG